MHKRALAVGMALVMILFAMASPGWAAPQPQARSVITYPTNGMTVSGVVEVTGIATHPNMNFYQVRYAAGPQPTGDSQWVDILPIVGGKQVENDVLNTWDTTTIPDGQYTLALAVWGVDDAASPYLFFVTNLTVNNAQPVASPTPEESPTPEPMPTAVIGPSPTPVTIEQPATPTSRPSPTPSEQEGGGTPTSVAGEDAGADFTLNVDALRRAFCDGILITVSLFALWGLYLLAKAGARWFLRQRHTHPPG